MKILKYSRQRESIEKAVHALHCHPTADEVYQAVREETPSISLGTVYRNLNTLAELGRIKKISMPEGGDRFDYNLTTHYHATCHQCGKVFDIALPNPQQIAEKIHTETGFSVTGFHFVAKGVCSRCKQGAVH